MGGLWQAFREYPVATVIGVFSSALAGLWQAFREHPVATVTGVLSSALAVLTLLQGLHVLHGQVATWLDGAVAVLTLILGTLARAHVTPVAKPRAKDGTPLVPMGPQYPTH